MGQRRARHMSKSLQGVSLGGISDKDNQDRQLHRCRAIWLRHTEWKEHRGEPLRKTASENLHLTGISGNTWPERSLVSNKNWSPTARSARNRHCRLIHRIKETRSQFMRAMNRERRISSPNPGVNSCNVLVRWIPGASGGLQRPRVWTFQLHGKAVSGGESVVELESTRDEVKHIRSFKEQGRDNFMDQKGFIFHPSLRRLYRSNQNNRLLFTLRIKDPVLHWMLSHLFPWRKA